MEAKIYLMGRAPYVGSQDVATVRKKASIQFKYCTRTLVPSGEGRSDRSIFLAIWQVICRCQGQTDQIFVLSHRRHFSIPHGTVKTVVRGLFFLLKKSCASNPFGFLSCFRAWELACIQNTVLKNFVSVAFDSFCVQQEKFLRGLCRSIKLECWSLKTANTNLGTSGLEEILRCLRTSRTCMCAKE